MASHQRICEIVLLSLLALVPFVCNQTAAPTTATTGTGTPGTDTTTENLYAIDSSTGKGNGVWEETGLPPAKLCVVGDNSTKANCANLKTELPSQFHVSEKLGNLTNGMCGYLTDGPPKNDSSDTKVIRCVYMGGFTNNNGTPDVCRLHFFNDNPANDEILVVGYWGRANIPTDVILMPIA